MRREGGEQNQPCGQHRDERGNSEKSQSGPDGDELSDQREEVPNHEVNHREPSPEGAEAVEDEYGVAAMGSRAQADGHLLHDASHAERENHKGKKESNA